MNRRKLLKSLVLFFILLGAVSSSKSQVISTPTVVEQVNPLSLSYNVSGSLIKKVTFDVTITYYYASLSLLAGNEILIDNIDIPTVGTHTISAIVEFSQAGNHNLEIRVQSGDITINTMDIQDFTLVQIPYFNDISVQAGMDRVNTYKYYGPCVADINQDGYYDFIVVNHNIETNKLYWNNGNGTVTKHHQKLSRWYKEDLHGTSVADYDNDGDLDVISTKGGGNGTAPTYPDFWRNDNDTLVIVSESEIGFSNGARGRGARWMDLDLDGDLDFVLVNAPPLDLNEKPYQFFYKNKGDGTFEFTNVSGIENAKSDRALVTDLNGDNIDDIILYGWGLSVWQGNGDFTFTDITSKLPGQSTDYNYALACTDIDIDNDGDFDLYFAKGNSFGTGFSGPTVDYNPVNDRMDLKIGWIPGSFVSTFTADDAISFSGFNYDVRGTFIGGANNFPIVLGSKKDSTQTTIGDTLIITPDMAQGWPADISGNGIYFGYLGSGNWKSALVINGEIFWNLSYSIDSITTFTTEYKPENRNIKDVLLRNDGGTFTDVSDLWNIPLGGGHNGVQVADYNNDGFNDLFIHRWGHLKYHTSDLMLLNTGNGTFETITMHGAHDPLDKGHGDMGQSFDFDMDGDIDMLNGSDELGMWYLYENTYADSNNYSLVNVGYSPVSNVDQVSAEVILYTPNNEYRKRVGSSGEVYSQSLMNIVHFGLGKEDIVDSVAIRWRNGERMIIKNKSANMILDTRKVDPQSILLNLNSADVREGESIKLNVTVDPANAYQDVLWVSSDTSVLKVSQDGWITPVGTVGQSAVITASSKASSISASSNVTIVSWFEMLADTVIVTPASSTEVETYTIQLSYDIKPYDVNDKSVVWSSLNTDVAMVDQNGLVSIIAPGDAEIRATSKNGKYGLCSVTGLPIVPGSITFSNPDTYLNTNYISGDFIKIECSFAATTKKVVDGNGIKYWLREIDENGAVVSNKIFSDNSVYNKASGDSKGIIRLRSTTPSSELPQGHYYQLWISFYEVNGNLIECTQGISPITIENANVYVSEDSMNSIKMYPNPANDFVYFSGFPDANFTVTICTILGNKVIEQELTNYLPLSISSLKPDLYIVRIESQTVTKTMTLIIE